MHPSKERIEIVDIVRGFALFGMLLANVGVFTHTDNGSLNNIASNIYSLFIVNKFYVIFAMLFGLSFYIFMSRPQNDEYTFAKRTFILLIIGVIHLIFIWHLDILHAYALVGFLLLLFFHMELKSIKKWIIIMFLLDIALASYFSSYIMEYLLQPTAKSLIDSYSAVSYLENLEFTFMNFSNQLVNTLVYIPRYLFLFLIGLYIGKSGLYAQTKERQWEIKNICGLTLAGTIIFLVLWMLSVQYNFGDHFTDPVIRVYNFFLGSSYITLLVLAYHKFKNNYIWERFKVIGKMTLTSYLSHSIIYLILFYEFNLGMYYEYPTTIVPAIALPLFFLQAEISRLWLNRFSQGPVEIVWRYFTYGKRKQQNITAIEK